MKFYENLNLTIASEVYIVQQENLNTFHLSEVYSLQPSKSIIMKELLDWNMSSDLTDKIILSTSKRRQNLYGHTFRAAIVVRKYETKKNLVLYFFDSITIFIEFFLIFGS